MIVRAPRAGASAPRPGFPLAGGLRRAILGALLGALLVIGASCSGPQGDLTGPGAPAPQGPPIRVWIVELESPPAGTGDASEQTGPPEAATSPLDARRGPGVETPIYVRGPGAIQIYSVGASPVLLQEIDRQPCEIRVVDGQVMVAGELFTGSHFRIAASEKPVIEIRVGEGSAEDFREYRGVLDFFHYPGEGEGELVRVINELSLEEYLAGVLAMETGGADFPLEALKAQAVVARTYTLYHLKRNFDTYGELPPDMAFESDESFQAYLGTGRENERIIEAVRDTLGVVLTTPENQLFQAYYHSTCGGHTASGELFGERAIRPLSGVPCEHCQDAPRYAWTRQFSRSDLEGVLRAWAAFQGVDMKGLVALRPVDPYPSEHCAYLRVVHVGGAFEIRMDTFRRLIARHHDDPGERVPSGRFTVGLTEDGTGYVFSGRGHGHGVGLCQYGARKLGESAPHGKILAHYFPDAGQKKVY